MDPSQTATIAFFLLLVSNMEPRKPLFSVQGRIEGQLIGVSCQLHKTPNQSGPLCSQSTPVRGRGSRSLNLKDNWKSQCGHIKSKEPGTVVLSSFSSGCGFILSVPPLSSTL